MIKFVAICIGVLLTSAAFVFLLTTSNNKQITVYRSQSWWFKGVCDGTEQVYKWEIVGLPKQTSWHIKPWLPLPIYIRGIELTMISGDISGWFGAGNNIVGDMMVFMGPGQTHVLHDFPAGATMPMPSSIAAKDTDYLDLHGLCHGGAIAALWYTVYYTYER